MNKQLIGIIGAMPEEIDGIILLLSNIQKFNHGMRTYYKGELNGIPTIVVFSRWGKVAAATTVTTLIVEFKITELIFTGVAGAIHSDLNIGDIVIGNQFVQHDMDARPLMKQHEIPLLGKTILECSEERISITTKSIQELLSTTLSETVGRETLSKFGILKPSLFVGMIASGDKFFANTKDKRILTEQLPGVLCVEMEGAAVAQVCYEYKIHFTIIRVISDTADDNAIVDFTLFINRVSSIYSVEVIKKLYASMKAGN